MMREFTIATKNLFILAICGDEQYNQSWNEMWNKLGRTYVHFLLFYQANNYTIIWGSSWLIFLFSMDNLNNHHNLEMLGVIARARHHYISRAPCWSCDGAIEYVFNTIHSYLLFFCPKLQNMNDLEATLEIIILGLFSKYFRHVGFHNWFF